MKATESAWHCDEATNSLLQMNGFDPATFVHFRELLANERDNCANCINGLIEPPHCQDVLTLPDRDTPSYERLELAGRDAITRGEVGAVILAGGMATRFGGTVKAALEVSDGVSFLDAKLADIRMTAERLRSRIPVYIMTSFATHEEVTRLAAGWSCDRMPVETFRQFISLRLTEDGSLFHDDHGGVSPYATGHGDLTFALRRAVLGRFSAAGGRILFTSNVDNIGATLNPSVIGAHVQHGRAVTCEVVKKEFGDTGGMPARVDGSLQIVEAFRFPKDFDQTTIPFFNTNTFVFTAAAIDRDFELTWFAVKKTVSGRRAFQFERLVGELTAFLPTAFLCVPRDGIDTRFLPIKDPSDLLHRGEALRQLLRSRRITPARSILTAG